MPANTVNVIDVTVVVLGNKFIEQKFADYFEKSGGGGGG